MSTLMTMEQLEALSNTELASVWNSARENAEAVKETIAYEQEVRKLCAARFFPEVKEGTEYAALPAQWRLKRSLPFVRIVDVTVLPSVNEKLLSIGVDPASVFRWKPEVDVRGYKSLTDEQRAIADVAITTKPGSLALELVAPKVKK